MAFLTDNCPPVADLSNLSSRAEEIHSVTISTNPAVTPPSIRLRTDSLAPPTFHVIWSISSSKTGNRPLTQNTTAIQAIHEMDALQHSNER